MGGAAAPSLMTETPPAHRSVGPKNHVIQENP
jgi:hypothetical protein